MKLITTEKEKEDSGRSFLHVDHNKKTDRPERPGGNDHPHLCGENTHHKSGPQVSPFTLAFNRSCEHLEAPFLDAYARESLPHIRLSLVLAILIWSAFSVLDIMLAPDVKNMLLWLRLGIISPVALCVFAFSFLPVFRRFIQASSCLVIGVAGIGVVVMILVVNQPTSYLYYAGLILVFFYGSTLLKIRFVWLTLTMASVSVIHEIAVNHVGNIPAAIHISNNFFLFGAVLMGMLASYFTEYSNRRRYFLTRLLQNEQKKLAHANKNLEKRVISRTRDLEESNQKLKESEKRLITILDTVQSGIVMVDTGTCRVTNANLAALAMLDGTKPEVIGRNYQDLIGTSQATGSMSTKTESPSVQNDHFLITLTGNRVPILKTEAPILLADRQYLLISFLSIKEIKDAEMERNSLEKQLVQAQKLQALGTLAGGIAHDFNNILFAILGFAELAMDDALPDSEQMEQLAEITTGARRASELVNQILTFSRHAEQQRRPTALKPLAMEVMQLLKATLPATIIFKQDLPSDIKLVMADPAQIHQIFMNLCTNAAHAMKKKGGTVQISLRNRPFDQKTVAKHHHIEPGNYVCIKVQDTGHGIAPDIRNHIFDPFFTTKPQGEGTGMGLSVVHGIVKDHGGEIMVESDTGRGSTFTVYLPALIDESEEETIPIIDIPKGNERLLVVDDETSLVKMQQQMLTRLGYTVTAVTSSREALAIIEEAPGDFDLLITDLTMPDMTGLELSRNVLAIRPDIPVLLCSGFSEDGSEKEAMQLGIHRIVRKPIKKQQIAQAIRNALAG